MSLFFTPSTLKGRPILLQFRAGTMTIANGIATPDTAKGYVAVIQNSNGLIEVCWEPIEAGTASTTVSGYATYGDATFEKVEKCTTGTVFALCFQGLKDALHTRLFWLQESNKREADIITSMKKIIGDEQCRKRLSAATGGSAAAATSSAPNGGSAVAANSSATPNGGTAAATSSTDNNKGPISNETLQQILQNLSRRPVSDISLQQMMGSDELLQALREDPAFYLERLGEHLPPSHSNDIVSEVRNPQMSAAAATLQAAVHESATTLNEVLTAFGLPKPATTPPAPTTALCEAVIREHEAKVASPTLNPTHEESDNAGA